MTDTDALRSLRTKLEALRAKTVENGCTEAEALLAAGKLAELLDKHGLTEAQLDALGMDLAVVPIAVKRSPIEGIWPQVGLFAECLCYFELGRGVRNAVYFGRACDIMVAEYVHDVLERSTKAAVKAFRASASYRARRLPRTRNAALRAFQDGLSARVRTTLHELWWRRVQGRHGATAAEVVAQHRDTLRAALGARGIELTRKVAPLKGAGARYHNERWDGAIAGAGIRVEPGLAAGTRIAGLLGKAS